MSSNEMELQITTDHCLSLALKALAPQSAQVVYVGWSQLLTMEMEMVSMHAVRLYYDYTTLC